MLAKTRAEEEGLVEGGKPRVNRATRGSFDKQQMLTQMKAMHTHGDGLGDGHGDHGGGHGHEDAALKKIVGGAGALGSALGVTKVAKKVAAIAHSPAKQDPTGKKYSVLKKAGDGPLSPHAKEEKKVVSSPEVRSVAWEGDGVKKGPGHRKSFTAAGVKIHPGGDGDEDGFSAHQKELKDAANEFMEDAADGHLEGSTFKGVDLSSIYPFGSPILFTKSLDMILLFNTFYLSVFVANYLGVITKKDSTGEQVVYIVIILAPIFLLFPFVAYCVRTTSILNAISNLDVEVVGKVIDETEDMLNIQHEVFDVFRKKMEDKGLGPSDLQKLFLEIDADNSGEIDAKELKTGLHAIGMHFSKNKFKRLFRAVDRDRSGNISFPEFFHLVYPEEPIPGDKDGKIKEGVMGLEAILHSEAESSGFK